MTKFDELMDIITSLTDQWDLYCGKKWLYKR